MARGDSANPFSTLTPRAPLLLPNEPQVGVIGRGFNRAGDGTTPINLTRRQSMRVRQGLTQTISLSRQGYAGAPRVGSEAFNRVVRAWDELTNQIDGGARTIVVSPDTQRTIVSDSNF